MLDLGIVMAFAVVHALAICAGKIGKMRLAIVGELLVLPPGAFGRIAVQEGFRRRRR